jgi:hypothetical protein
MLILDEVEGRCIVKLEEALEIMLDEQVVLQVVCSNIGSAFY